MAKEKKNYTFTTKDGRATVSMQIKGKDGRYHSASCQYPYRPDGKGRALSRKQTEEFLLAKVVNA